MKPCIEYRGAKDSGGYGKISVGGGQFVGAHRLAYTLYVGPLLAADVVRHTCDNPSCIEPSHLIKGSASDNALDSVNRGRHHYASRTHCSRGHEYTEENTRMETTSQGTRRVCRQCDAIRHRKADS